MFNNTRLVSLVFCAVLVLNRFDSVAGLKIKGMFSFFNLGGSNSEGPNTTSNENEGIESNNNVVEYSYYTPFEKFQISTTVQSMDGTRPEIGEIDSKPVRIGWQSGQSEQSTIEYDNSGSSDGFAILRIKIHHVGFQEVNEAYTLTYESETDMWNAYRGSFYNKADIKNIPPLPNGVIHMTGFGTSTGSCLPRQKHFLLNRSLGEVLKASFKIDVRMPLRNLIRSTSGHLEVKTYSVPSEKGSWDNNGFALKTSVSSTEDPIINDNGGLNEKSVSWTSPRGNGSITYNYVTSDTPDEGSSSSGLNVNISGNQGTDDAFNEEFKVRCNGSSCTATRKVGDVDVSLIDATSFPQDGNIRGSWNSQTKSLIIMSNDSANTPWSIQVSNGNITQRLVNSRGNKRQSSTQNN